MKLYLMVVGVKMMNSYFALVFPFVIMTFGIFFMRLVITSISDELLEAARVDGANEFWIYVRVVLALSKSGLMALDYTFLRELPRFYCSLEDQLAAMESTDVQLPSFCVFISQRPARA